MAAGGARPATMPELMTAHTPEPPSAADALRRASRRHRAAIERLERARDATTAALAANEEPTPGSSRQANSARIALDAALAEVSEASAALVEAWRRRAQAGPEQAGPEQLAEARELQAQGAQLAGRTRAYLRAILEDGRELDAEAREWRAAASDFQAANALRIDRSAVEPLADLAAWTTLAAAVRSALDYLPEPRR